MRSSARSRSDSFDAGAAATCEAAPQHLLLRVMTAGETDFIDLSDRLVEFVVRAHVRTGLLAVHTLHTTTAVVVNEDEPLLRADVRRQLERLAPRASVYAHDDPRRRRVNRVPDERVNGHAHCRAVMLGSSVCLSIVEGRLLLGRWQRVLFVELDGPQERQVAATIVAGAR